MSGEDWWLHTVSKACLGVEKYKDHKRSKGLKRSFCFPCPERLSLVLERNRTGPMCSYGIKTGKKPLFYFYTGYRWWIKAEFDPRQGSFGRGRAVSCIHSTMVSNLSSLIRMVLALEKAKMLSCLDLER